MSKSNYNKPANRRDFLGKLAGTAAFVGVSSLAVPLGARAESAIPSGTSENPDEWFKGVKGKHRVVFDASMPNVPSTFGWPKIFLMSNATSGTPESDCGVVVVLRHEAIALAFQDDAWAKYKFGEKFNIKDQRTNAPAVRNPFWNTQPDDFKIPGFGAVAIGIRALQASGVMFCVCDVALTVHSAAIGMELKQDGAAIKKEWLAGLIPGIQVVPSGVWAVGRAQEHGCTYCYAG